MPQTEMQSLAERLEEMAQDVDKTSEALAERLNRFGGYCDDDPDDLMAFASDSADLRAAARCVKAMAKLEEFGADDSQFTLQRNFTTWFIATSRQTAYTAHKTALEAIEAQP